MTEHTRNGKGVAQDATGVVFALLGGFFAVSIVLFLRGQEPKQSVSVVTWPVVELVTLLGSLAALFFSAGLAALGTLLFLRPTPLAALRPLMALSACSLGAALVAGAFGGGGELGALLPGLLAGFAGRALAAVVGLALAWLGWTLLPAARQPVTSTAEAVQRIGLAARHDAAGVTPAEAALLVTEPRAPLARPARREEPVREATIRPFTPADATLDTRSKRPAPAPARAAPIRPVEAPLAAAAAPRPVAAAPVRPAAEASSASTLIPPPPSWELAGGEIVGEAVEPPVPLEQPRPAPPEQRDGRADATDEEALETLAEELAEEFEAEEAEEAEEEDVGVEALAAATEEPGSAVSAAPATPRASWEQIGLFDEEELVDEEASSARAAPVELTPTFDFEAAEPRKVAHEPDELPAAANASAAAAAHEEQEKDGQDGEDDAPAAHDAPAAPAASEEPSAAARAPREDFVLEPVPAPRPEPVVTRDEESERWSRLVYDAGCAILEQKRVAVSMLERRFAIDFDQACRVLDELQQAGLIGPYMGGRTRDILLTREEWLPHAPHAP